MNLQALTLRRGTDARPAFFAAVCDDDVQTRFGAPEVFLGATESAQWNTLRFPQKKRAFLLGRVAAKMTVGALIGETDWRNIDVRTGVFGQPLVHHVRVESIDVTLSHSNGLAVALAFPGEWPMGIDLESVPAASVAAIMGELQASDAEHAWLASRLVDEPAACGILWSAREAIGKSMKIGLNCPLGILSLSRIQADRQGLWAGRYTNFPQSKCFSEVIDGRVLTLAMPAEIDLAPWPKLHV